MNLNLVVILISMIYNNKIQVCCETVLGFGPNPNILPNEDRKEWLLEVGFLLYPSKKVICGLLKAPLRFSRIYSIASKGAIPSSINAIATNTGALPNPATQCTATVGCALHLVASTTCNH